MNMEKAIKLGGGLVIIFIIALVISFLGRRSGNSDADSQTSYITITTTTWKMVEIGKRKYELDIVEQNGKKLKYFLSVNDVHNPREIPLRDGEQLNLDYRVKKLYISLKPNQGATTAQIVYTEK